MKKISLILANLIFLAIGCSSKQDPLEGKDDSVRNPKQPSQKIEAAVPEQSEVIRIDTVNKFTFIEGREDKISIMTRVLAPDYENQVFVVNQSEFPGSSFDAATGVFSWLPPKGFIFDGLSKTLELNIRVFSKSTVDGAARVFTKDRSVEVVVEKSMGAPVIVKVEGIPDLGFHENETYQFTVLVRDEDSGPVHDSYPRLIFNPPAYGTPLAPFIKVIQVVPDFAKREFLYSYTIDFGRMPLTDGYVSAGFIVKAISRYNIHSAGMSIDSKLHASFSAPKSSWTKVVEMRAGVTIDQSFVIYEPTGRSEFEIGEMYDVPEGAVIDCDTSNGKGIMPCTFSWTVPADAELGEHTISFKVRAMRKYYTDVKAVESEVELKYLVKKAIEPTPEPTPRPKAPRTGGKR